jgi:predicted Zn-dependent protease
MRENRAAPVSLFVAARGSYTGGMMDVLKYPLDTAQSFLNLGRGREALAVLEEVPLMHRTDDRYEHLLVEVYLGMERWDKAYEAATALLAESPDDGLASVQIAVSLLEMNKEDAAESVLADAHESAKADARYHYLKARLLARDGLREEARAALAAALDINPDIAKKAAALPGMARLLGEL